MASSAACDRHIQRGARVRIKFGLVAMGADLVIRVVTAACRTKAASCHLQTPHPPRALFLARLVPCDRARDPFSGGWMDIRSFFRSAHYQVPQFMTTPSSYFVEYAQLNLDSTPQFGYHDILCEPLCICPGMAVGCISRSLPSCTSAVRERAGEMRRVCKI